MDAPILISPHWDIEFHVHKYATSLVVGAILAQNLIGKCNQLIAHASQLLNNIEWNYNMIEREALAMVYALHKFCHYLLSNKFILCVDHMALLYSVWKSQVSRKIGRWLLIFLEYNFLVISKLGRSHSMADSLFWMPDFTEESGVLNQTMDASLFLLQLVWLQEISKYFTTKKFLV